MGFWPVRKVVQDNYPRARCLCHRLVFSRQTELRQNKPSPIIGVMTVLSQGQPVTRVTQYGLLFLPHSLVKRLWYCFNSGRVYATRLYQWLHPT